MASESLLRRFLNGYRFTAFTLLNTLVGFAILNSALWVAFFFKDHWTDNPVSRKYSHADVMSLYPGCSEAEVDELLMETWSRPYIFEPFTQFKERPFRGRYVNVHPEGFRYTKGQGPWPPQPGNLNIFIFGGSTIFGYGARDEETLASYLQECIVSKLGRNVSVYNFGRGHYYLTQERILFEHLLASGFTPHLAIFVDGLNDFYCHANEPFNTDDLRAFVANDQPMTRIKALMPQTSFSRAASGLADTFTTWLHTEKSRRPSDEQTDTVIDVKRYGDPQLLDGVIRRYLADKKLIEAVSEGFGVKPIFVWQPAPTYRYDQRYHRFTKGGYAGHSYSKYGYERMARKIKEKPMDSSFIWCADIQSDSREPLYIDKMHYSPGFSKRFAETIAQQLMERHHLPLSQQK